MLYIRYPLSLRQVEDILFERGIDICHETVRYWWNRFAPVFAGEIRRRRVDRRDDHQHGSEPICQNAHRTIGLDTFVTVVRLLWFPKQYRHSIRLPNGAVFLPQVGIVSARGE